VRMAGGGGVEWICLTQDRDDKCSDESPSVNVR
jgi:hypothetical protein